MVYIVIKKYMLSMISFFNPFYLPQLHTSQIKTSHTLEFGLDSLTILKSNNHNSFRNAIFMCSSGNAPGTLTLNSQNKYFTLYSFETYISIRYKHLNL